MFFTGDAGTGKSYVLRLIVSALKKKFGSQKVFVTASTALPPATSAGRRSTRSRESVAPSERCDVGVGDESVTKCVRRILQNKKAKQRWQTCAVLIVDGLPFFSPSPRDLDAGRPSLREARGDRASRARERRVFRRDPADRLRRLLPAAAGGSREEQRDLLLRERVLERGDPGGRRSSPPAQKIIIMKKVFRQKDVQLQALLRDIRYVREWEPGERRDTCRRPRSRSCSA